MSLTRKALVKTAFTMLMLALALYLLARFSLADGISQLEEDMTFRNGNQAVKALDRDIEELDIIASDWAQWDDTYFFVQDQTKPYAESNLVDSTFTNNRLNFIILYDHSGSLVYSRGFSWRDKKGEKIADGVQDYFAGLISQQGMKENSGLLYRGGRLCMVSAQPVLTSDGQTGPNGLLVMGRNLNETEIARLEEQTQLEISIHPFSEGPDFLSLADQPAGDRASEKPADLAVTSSSVQGSRQEILVQAWDDDTIRAYAPLTTIDGSQEFYLQVDASRALHQQGRTGMLLFVAGLLFLALVCCLLIVTILRTDILEPLQLLAEKVGVIGRMQDSAARVEFAGEGELQALADDINAMLERLEASRTGQEQSNRILGEKEQQLRFILSAMDQGFLAFGPDLKAYPESSAACLKLLGHDPAGQDASRLLHAGAPGEAFEWEDTLKKALQAENPEKAGYYLKALPASLLVNDRVLKLYYHLAAGFNRNNPASIAVFIKDCTETSRLEQELAGRQGQMELLQAVLADSRGFAELVDHYIYFYTSELPGWYEGLENQEQAYVAARKALQRLQVFAERFLGYKLASTGSGLHEICRQLERLLEQKALDSAGLAELASPDRLEALIQDDLILIESYLGEDLQRS